MKYAKFFMIIMIFLAACQPDETSLIQNAANKIEVSDTQAAIVGQVSSNNTSEPLTETVVWLAKVFWNEDQSEGAYVLDGAASPSDITDENGVFVFKELKPAEYVIVVGDLMGDHEIIREEEGGKVKIYNADPGMIIQVEPLSVDLPK